MLSFTNGSREEAVELVYDRETLRIQRCVAMNRINSLTALCLTAVMNLFLLSGVMAQDKPAAPQVSPEKQKLTGHSKKVVTVKCHPAHPMVISGSADKTIRVWKSGNIFFPFH